MPNILASYAVQRGVGISMTRGGIAEHRLQVVGFGEEKPKTDDPYDRENRRVDVVNVTLYE